MLQRYRWKTKIEGKLTLVAGAYYGIDTFYPGGFVGAMTAQARIIEQNQAINPRFNLYRDVP
jgi:hypothetical protein